jgi:hypothetical protein
LPDPERPQDLDFEVLPENWPTIQMFLRVQTQWRTAMNGLVGLDYGAVEWLFRLYAVDDPRALLEGLQVMEAAAIVKLNDRGK